MTFPIKTYIMNVATKRACHHHSFLILAWFVCNMAWLNNNKELPEQE